ncbi:MAG: TIGR00288 family NYN domain-containing protein [Candidatus Hydrothermarchaeota archaeon]
MMALERISRVKDIIGRRMGGKRIAILVDGPNMLRKEFNINLEKVKKIIEQYGDIKIAKVFLNQYASEKLVEAIMNQGFMPVVTTGDVDVYLTVEAMEIVYNPHVDMLALITRDADFLPLLMKAKENGMETVVYGAEPGFSTALKNAADHVIQDVQEEATT